MALGRRKHMDMTVGSVPKNILLFAFPLLLGNLFQQLYNMVDTWVIGQTGQNGAYAAVGSIGPVINILIGFFLGLSSGAGVVISQYFGAKKEEDVRRAVHTSVAMTLVMGVLFTVLGLWLSPYILRLMLNGEQSVEVYPFAKTYLTIYFAGVMGLMVYNMGSVSFSMVRPAKVIVASPLTAPTWPAVWQPSRFTPGRLSWRRMWI